MTKPISTLNEYQDEARRTAQRSLDAYPLAVQAASAATGQHTADSLLRIHDTFILAMGLAGEAGEVCDLLKKVQGHGKPYEAEKLKKELGDVLWYLANLADAHGFTLQDVAQTNADKLRARHPNGFTVASAEAKADEVLNKAPIAPHALVQRSGESDSAYQARIGADLAVQAFMATERDLSEQVTQIVAAPIADESAGVEKRVVWGTVR